MDISNPRYIRVQGYPILEVEIDGQTRRIGAEQKPTLVRHGMVAIGSDVAPGASLPNGRRLESSTDDPEMFRLATSFGLDCHYGRFKEGDVGTNIDPEEFRQLGERVERFGMDGSPSWEAIGRRIGLSME